METSSAPPRQTGFVITIFIGLALLVAVFLSARVLVQKSRIDPAQFFSTEVPSRLRPLLSLQLEGGKLAEFFDAASKHKLSVVIADRLSTREGVLPEDLMRELDLERLGKSDYQRVERVILRYGAAQFNVLAAGNVAPTLVPVAGRDITAQRFTTTRGANFLMGILEGREGQVFFLALRKGEPVDAVFIGQLLSAMPAARGDVSAQIEAGS